MFKLAVKMMDVKKTASLPEEKLFHKARDMQKYIARIAHRMRTIANADKVVVLDKGKVVEMGEPQQLMKNRGLFISWQ